MSRIKSVTAGLMMALGASAAAAQPSPPSAAEPDLSVFHTVSPDRLLTRPNLADLFPVTALDAGFDGAATIHCLLEPDTRLHDCTVVKETPPGYSFGTATLKAAERFRIRPLIRDGAPVQHEKVELLAEWGAHGVHGH